VVEYGSASLLKPSTGASRGYSALAFQSRLDSTCDRSFERRRKGGYATFILTSIFCALTKQHQNVRMVTRYSVSESLGVVAGPGQDYQRLLYPKSRPSLKRVKSQASIHCTRFTTHRNRRWRKSQFVLGERTFQRPLFHRVG
jgi:hypothetical protein